MQVGHALQGVSCAPAHVAQTLPGRCRLPRGLGGLRGLLAALGRLDTEFLREALDAAFGIDELLPAGEEWVTVRADLEVQLILGRMGLPGRAAGATHFNFVIL